MALDVNIEAALGSQRLQAVCDMLNSRATDGGLAGRPSILLTGAVMTEAQVATATGVTTVQINDIHGRTPNFKGSG